MFVTKKFFEKWVEKNIGIKKTKELADSYLHFIWGTKSETLREKISSLESDNRMLTTQMLHLTNFLGVEYKTTPEKTGFVKIKKKR